MARPFYDKDSVAKKSANKSLRVLYDSKEQLSPFWYRGYFLDAPVKKYTNGKVIYKAAPIEIETALKKFNVNRIITGHTMVGNGDCITAHYDGKVINTDTWHKTGRSEGLLIIGDVYYRAGRSGKQIKLLPAAELTPSPKFVKEGSTVPYSK